MGVPRFFSWITKRYPMSKQDLEDYPLPDIDCLYLDMNGIIYKCSKDDSIIFRDQVMSRKAEEIWFSIFNYINSIVDMIKPRKLLFLGLDGVAPRAKMNNQRARRFRSAKDYKELERKLEYFGDAKNEEEFKNNCITPGTEFMSELNKQLRFFIAKKIQEDVKWKEFNVIFSGADVPGEGEHKIMDFIRRSTDLKVYDDNTSHCLYGADADLIMLGMSLSVKKLCIIREEFVMKSKKTVITHTRNVKEVKFQIIYVNILKEYFDLEYKVLAPEMKIKYDAQRVLNDFVFLCFFIGNDFLPRCYCYDIRQGNLEMLIFGFKKFLKQSNDYLLNEHSINLKQLERLTIILSEFEGHFISSRSSESRRAYRGIKNDNPDEDDMSDLEQFEEQFRSKLLISAERMKTQEQFLLLMKTLYANDSDAAKSVYYQMKLKFSPQTEPQKLFQLIGFYIHGLQYVYHYYFGGLPSWEWYYPYYYAPLVSDLAAYLSWINSNNIPLPPFNKSAPYEPFKQLICNLPRQSAQLLPKCLQYLVQDQGSPLRSPIDYFPDKVQVDPYGGLQQHEFINILPFIDQNKITEVYDSIPKSAYTQQQLTRNTQTLNELYKYSQTNKILIKTSYSQIKDFKAPMTIELINFATDDVLKLKPSQTKTLNIENQKQLTFPTLYSRQFKAVMVHPSKKERRIELILPKIDEEKINLKLSSEVYFGYPHECHGRVMAISTPKELKYLPQFDILDFLKDSRMTQSDLQDDSECWKEALKYVKIKGLQINPDKIYFLKQSKVTFRKYNGQYVRSYTLTYNRIQPAAVVSAVPKYPFTHTLFKPKSIKEEFLIGQQVVILQTKWAGSKGIVVGYDKDRLVRVKITDPIPNIPEEVLQAVNTNQFFFSIKFAARLLDMDVRVLLDMLDSVQVFLDTQQAIALTLSRTLDLGLNLIKRSQRKIVPNLVRLPNQGAEVDNLFKLFFNLEISVEAIKLLYQYKKEHPEVFKFMHKRMNQLEKEAKESGSNVNFKKDIYAADMYPNEKDPNKPVTKAYLWLLKQQQIYYHNASINSKKVSKTKIVKLLQYFRNMKPAEPLKDSFDFDPNYLYTQRLVEKGNVYLSRNPKSHAIQDRVVCFNQAYFGQRAVIIGISDYEYQVLFERPSFGKNDLGGLVEFLWGGKFDFRELFNITSYDGLIQPRFGSQIDYKTNLKRYWDGVRPDFVSRYQGRAIGSIKQFKQVSKLINLPFEIGQNLAKSSKDVEDEFIIVTGKKNLKQYFPTQGEKKVLDKVTESTDFMKIVKQYAQSKTFLVEQAIPQKQEIVNLKKKQDFIRVKSDEPEQKQIKPTKVISKQKAPQPPLKIQKSHQQKSYSPKTKPKQVINNDKKPKYVQKKVEVKEETKTTEPSEMKKESKAAVWVQKKDQQKKNPQIQKAKFKPKYVLKQSDSQMHQGAPKSTKQEELPAKASQTQSSQIQKIQSLPVQIVLIQEKQIQKIVKQSPTVQNFKQSDVAISLQPDTKIQPINSAPTAVIQVALNSNESPAKASTQKVQQQNVPQQLYDEEIFG